VIELVGSSSEGWDEAVQEALKRARSTLKNIVEIEVLKNTADVKNGDITAYNSRVKISFIVDEIGR